MICKRLFNSTRHLAHELAFQLEHQNQRIVFTESCTAGLVSAILAQVPGISNWLCGSVVSYQESAKVQWLEIDPKLIERHSAVSAEVTAKMAESILTRTPSADFSVAITGHLEHNRLHDGPAAFVCVGYRNADQIICTQPVYYQLGGRTRVDRQWQAARFALKAAVDHLHNPPVIRMQLINWVKIVGEQANFHWPRWL